MSLKRSPPRGAVERATSGEGGLWDWADACPEFVRKHGWRARAYGKDGSLQSVWYNLSIFDVPPDFWAAAFRQGDGSRALLDEGALERCDSSEGQAGQSDVLEAEEDEEVEEREQGGLRSPTSRRLTCSKCRCPVDVSERLAHYQSAWHLHNLRRALVRKPPISLEEFRSLYEEEVEERGADKQQQQQQEQVLLQQAAKGEGDADGSGGEDDEDDEEAAAGAVEMEVQSESAMISVNVQGGAYAITVWSPILSSEARRESNEALILALQSLGKPSTSPVRPSAMWTVIIMRSGKFAGAVFEGTRVVVHKAFKRYTTRRKAGGSQSSYDKKGRRAQSVGAALRRYGEVMTREDVARILESWAPQVEACSLIFLSVPKALRNNLVGPERPLFHKDDPRLRSVPFMTEDPSFAEVQAVHAKLSTARFSAAHTPRPPTTEGPGKASALATSASSEDDGAISRATSEAISEDGSVRRPTFKDAGALFHGESEDSAPVWSNSKLYEAVRDGVSVEEVSELLEGLSVDDVNYAENEGAATVLHAAAAQGSEELVELLLDAGADPCALDERGRVPYYLCANKGVRDAFRRQRGKEPERWDWHRAGVPEALTEEAERKKREKQREKKKKARDKKKAEKERDAAQQAMAKEQQQAGGGAAEEEDEKEEDDDEDDGRLKCDNCKKSVRTMYTRLQFVYCSTNCVLAHKRTLLAEAALKRLG